MSQSFSPCDLFVTFSLLGAALVAQSVQLHKIKLPINHLIIVWWSWNLWKVFLSFFFSVTRFFKHSLWMNIHCLSVRACVCVCAYMCIAQPIEVTVGVQILIFYARPYKVWWFIMYVIGKSLKVDFPREHPHVGWIFTWLFDVKGGVIQRNRYNLYPPAWYLFSLQIHECTEPRWEEARIHVGTQKFKR